MCDTNRTQSRDFRRRGSVLILVTALLGMLFVMGVAFMASMNFEAEMIAAERRQSGVEDGIDGMFDEVGGLLKEGMPFAAVQLPGSSSTYAELPGYHNTFSPIEPSRDQASGDVVFDWFTDLESLRDEPFTGSRFMGMTLGTVLRNGSEDPDLNRVVVDADGDGIVDSVQFDLADVLEFSSEQLAELSELLNPFSEVTGEVNLGIRIIPHGGMVNLNESHPSLIDNVLDREGGYIHSPVEFGVFYSPALEENLLRRRGLLPPRIIPPSALHGNMFLDDDPDSTGDGDMLIQLFPPGETVFEDDHRYWGFEFDEMYPPGDPDAFVKMWSIRMEPETSFEQEPSMEEYDRRHLVTTISHDDLLARSVQITVPLPYAPPPDNTTEADIRDKMIEANQEYADPECAFLPFEYVDYPQDIPNEGDCACPSDEGCRFDPRKGRLLVSLPWIQDALDEGLISSASAIQLIQDTFMVMLFNAAGPMWEDECPSGGCLAAGEECVIDPGTGANICVDPQLRYQPHRLAQIARTAAALTANLIDFMDADSVPTRVEVRSCNFDEIDTVGRGFNPPVYVYGLERQPYITEVAVHWYEDDPTNFYYYGIELFNPHAEDIETLDQYYLRVITETGDVSYPLTQTIPAADFKAVVNDGAFPGVGATPEVLPGLVLPNTTGDSADIYLLREVQYLGDDLPTKIVVDQFAFAYQPKGTETPPFSFAMERPQVTAATPWYAPIAGGKTNPYGTSLGGDNVVPAGSPARRPVEVFFANTDDMRTAFPTTGSLLLLMRYANRSWDEHDHVPANLAFTTELGGLDRSVYYDVAAGGGVSELRDRFELIDNGHMPVFEKDGVYAHRRDPALEAVTNTLGSVDALPWGQLVFDYFTALPLSSGGPYRGDPDSLAGPASIPRVDMDGLRVHGRININAAPWRVLAGLPLMPVEAFQEYPVELRNKISMYAGLGSGDAFPIGEQRARAIVAYREMKELSEGLDSEGVEMTTGYYGTTVSPAPPNPYGRGWDDDDPAARRGTGFMTIGELLNVRHPDAYEELNQPFAGFGNYDDYSLYRMDSGVIESVDDTVVPPISTEDYVSAISLMVALGDWVTVRSQVFTIYGVLRGQEDLTITDEDPDLEELIQIRDIDSRAIRFQETVDRLPTFLGERLPVHIGERVITGYDDTQND